MEAETLRGLAVRVSQYFLDFLESDFKRQQAPRRRITLQTESGFRAGMRLAPYPGLRDAVWALLDQPVGLEKELVIKPRAFTRPMSHTLQSVVREQIQAIPESAVEEVRRIVLVAARDTPGRAIEDPERWVEETRLSLATALSEQIVQPLLATLDGPLSRDAYSPVDSVFAAEAELVERLGAELDAALPEALSRLRAANDESAVQAATATLLTIEGVRAALAEYFNSFSTADAFLEFRDIETYAATSDGMQLYLYIGGLKYGPQTYPLFFVPVEVDRDRSDNRYRVLLRNHVYANKRAVEYVLQELGAKQARTWVSPLMQRIEYLKPDESILAVTAPLVRAIAAGLDLPGQIELTPGPVREASTTAVTLTTALHFAAFDRADEALLNDYEDILAQAQQNQNGVIDLFEGIVRGVITDNPPSVNKEVDSHWEGLPFVERLVRDTPIPLNEEQAKMLDALDRDDCKIILVEGPPGTGKSHTIVAIAADCVLKQRSCLVLSDKKEALEVVQDKLSAAMSRVRHDKEFPNPLLRLGQDQSNFRRLTGNQALGQVTAYVRSMKANQGSVNADLEETRSELKRRIRESSASLSAIPMTSIATFHRLEAELDKHAPGLAERLEAIAPADALKALDGATGDPSALTNLLGAFKGSGSSGEFLRRARQLLAAAQMVHVVDRQALTLLDTVSVEQTRALRSILLSFEQLRLPVVGWLFRGKEVRVLESRLNAVVDAPRPLLLRQERRTLKRLLEGAEAIRKSLPEFDLQEGDLGLVYAAIAGGRALPIARPVYQVAQLVAGVLGEVPAELIAARSPSDLVAVWQLVFDFLESWGRNASAFRNARDIDYLGSKTHLERLNTMVMNAQVDERLVDYMNNDRADAKVLSSLISQRQKFPEDKFGRVKESFPVIVASIREFGEYMPLAPNQFDVLVIDEASQVSIAQAFPALLRAKKIVVLGDTKQFSNTKSANASNAQNDKYRSELGAYFRAKVSRDAGMLQRLSRFDVKCSVLEFVQLCANYTVMLRKHFRSYAELISFSSQTFYGGQLQAVKIRGRPIEEVIQFDVVDAAASKVTRGTNEAEAEFILARLLELLEDEEPPTVGVITPFREQQVLLSKKLFGHLQGGAFQDRLHLKIMTCDSCQGEERQLIFYSLVATRTSDALNYIFPVALDGADEVVEDKLKFQRLNVAFSRAQEMIWFVLSKPVEEFGGSIGRVLAHYRSVLDAKDAVRGQTDPASPMETKVLQWLQETAFYQQHRGHLEIVPQFPLGDYLRQLDPTYQHPAYRVDFLLSLDGPDGRLHIVIEYDGFKDHFQHGKDVHVGNYERYMLEGDVERQLTLESYGYRFLRINRFNLGRDPVQTLSDRLTHLVGSAAEGRGSAAMDLVQEQAAGLVDGDLKTCSRCGEIREQDEFFDQELRQGAGGYGRVCIHCKESAKVKPTSPRKWHPRRRWRRY